MNDSIAAKSADEKKTPRISTGGSSNNSVKVTDILADGGQEGKVYAIYHLTDGRNPKIKAVPANFGRFLEIGMNASFKYDDFTSQIICNGAIYNTDVDWYLYSTSWDGIVQKGARPAGPFPKDSVNQIIHAIAKNNQVDSCAEYMKGLPAWDGKDRISEFWQTYAGSDDDPAYLRDVARYFFTLLAGRMRYASMGAIKGDCVPVLSGPQGTMKSTLVQALAPFPDWYASARLTQENADWCRSVGGKSIVELEEMTGYKSDEQAKKARLSSMVDEWVEKYLTARTARNRHYAMIGTFNPDHGSGFLTDPTGNRRYAPIKVVRPCDPRRASRDLEQLLAQGLCLYDENDKQKRRDGITHMLAWPSGVLWADLDQWLVSGAAHKGHHAKAKHHDAIIDFLASCERPYITRTEAYREIGIKREGNAEEALRTEAFNEAGWNERTIRQKAVLHDGSVVTNQVRAFVRPEDQV